MIRSVKIKNGAIKGLPAADPRITAFKGIPFAAPPIGENRWRAPQPAENWQGELKAYDFGPVAMQAPTGVGDGIYNREWNVDPALPMSEDCLYLNVWTPAKTDSEKLPVLVWFFGGGLQCGYPSEMEFDGERLARRGIVVVTVNYRVNVFGFLTCSEIEKEQADAPANFGHLDQQAGIKWVKENIAAFGGDPDTITIAGQSAGGGSVMSQLTSPQSDGLFQRVIVESGIFQPPYGQEFIRLIQSMEDGKKLGERFFAFIGAKNLAEARAMDEGYIRDKYLEFNEMFGTVTDGVFCTDASYTAYRKGQRQAVPMLAGLTQDEFVSQFPCKPTQEDFDRKAKELFGDKADEFKAICFAGTAGNVEKAMQNAAVRTIEPTLRSMFETDDMPHYMYLFDTEIPGWDNPGSFHSVELWFFFETLAKCWRPFQGRHYDEARLMCNYWTNFVKTGNPNGEDADGSPMPEWKPYTDENPDYIYFSDKGIHMNGKPADPLHRFITEDLKQRHAYGKGE